MPSLFSRLAAVAGATVDAVYSEGFFLDPKAYAQTSTGIADVNARPVASATRQAHYFVGTFVSAGALVRAHGRTKADSATHAVAAEKPMIDVAESAMPQRPQPGDRIRRVDTGEVFAVAAYLPEDLGRAWVHLTEVRAQAPAR